VNVVFHGFLFHSVNRAAAALLGVYEKWKRYVQPV
jgi:hypothetical protein